MRIIILLWILSIVTTAIKAQQLKANSIVKTRHSSFKTENNQYGRMDVENSKNTFSKQRPKNQRFEIADPGIFGVSSAFKQVFSDARLKELLPETNLLISYYASPDGKVLEIGYHLKPNTIVTAAELESLETAIKEKVSLKLIWRGNDKNEANFVSVAQAVRYSAILDGTLKD